MRVLALDPSSTCTGYAVLERGTRDAGPVLVEAGRIRPPATQGAVAHITARMSALGREVVDLILEVRPDAVVIEVPTRHANRPGTGGSGLTTYGLAVGAVWMAAMIATDGLHREDGVHRVVTHSDERTWTGSVPKAERTALIAAQFRKYDPASDPGGDVADAIGLGLWWLEQRTGIGD